MVVPPAFQIVPAGGEEFPPPFFFIGAAPGNKFLDPPLKYVQ